MRKFINFRMSGCGAGRRAWRGRGVGATWCTKSRRPLFIRSLCTKSPAFLRPWPGGRGASPPASPCFFVLRHHVPEHSSRSAGRAWCLTDRESLFLRLGAPRPRAQQPFPPGGRGASPPASPCFFVLRHHVPDHSSRSRPAGVVPHRSLALVSSSWGTTSPSTAAVPAGRAWCLTAR